MLTWSYLLLIIIDSFEFTNIIPISLYTLILFFNLILEVNMSDIESKVKKIVAEHLDVEESKISANASFIDQYRRCLSINCIKGFLRYRQLGLHTTLRLPPFNSSIFSGDSRLQNLKKFVNPKFIRELWWICLYIPLKGRMNASGPPREQPPRLGQENCPIIFLYPRYLGGYPMH